MRWQGTGGEGGNVEDRRNMRPVAMGGGIIGIIIVLVGAYFGADLRPLAQQIGGGRMEQVGPPVNDETKKFATAVMGFNDTVWTEQFRQNDYGVAYEEPTMVLFSERVQT